MAARMVAGVVPRLALRQVNLSVFPSLVYRGVVRPSRFFSSSAGSKPPAPQVATSVANAVDSPSVVSSSPTPTKDDSSPGKVEGKMYVEYTCSQCDTRNAIKMSRQAYERGVVISRCKGCEKNHLISDNLGWVEKKGWNVVNDLRDDQKLPQGDFKIASTSERKS